MLLTRIGSLINFISLCAAGAATSLSTGECVFVSVGAVINMTVT